MEKNQITLTRSEAIQVRDHLNQTADDLRLLSQFVKYGLKISLLAEATIISKIANAIDEHIQKEVTFTLTL